MPALITSADPGASLPAPACLGPAGGAPASEFYIPSLDGLRALAFLMVFLSHCPALTKLLHLPGDLGEFGVGVFFLLSGYLITTLLRQEAERSGRISLSHFYLRRILRIFPPMYLCILAGLICVGLGLFPYNFSLWTVAAQCLHLHNYCVIAHVLHYQCPPAMIRGTTVLWSLAVEEHFYLIFPLAYILLRRCVPSARLQALILLDVCAAVLLWRVVLMHGLHAPSLFRITFATDTRLDSILLGCVLAIGANPMLDRRTPSARTLLVWGGLMLASFITLHHYATIWSTYRYTIEGLAILPVFIGAIRYHDRGPFRLLNLKSVRFLGVLSYSLYLFHCEVLYVLNALCGRSARHVPEIAQEVAALGLSIGVAAAVHYAVERPCAKLRRRLTNSSRRQPQLVYRPAPEPAPASTPAAAAA